MDQNKIAKFIQKVRNDKNLTQIELAEKLGVSNRTISKWENGKCLPDYSILNDLCLALDISVGELLRGEKIDNEVEENIKEKLINELKEKNRKLKKKKFKIGISILACILLLFLTLGKFLLIYFYGSNRIYYRDSEFPFNKNIHKLNIKNEISPNKSFFESEFYINDDFELITDKNKSLLVNDSCDLYLKNIDSNNIYDAGIAICSMYINIDDEDKDSWLDFFIGYRKKEKLYNKYKINDFLDLIKYYEKNYNKNFNLFSSNEEIFMKYLSSKAVQKYLTDYDNFYYLDGNIKGYFIEHTHNLKDYYGEALLFFKLNNDTTTTLKFMFYNNNQQYFNLDTVKNFLKSIGLNKSFIEKYAQ